MKMIGQPVYLMRNQSNVPPIDLCVEQLLNLMVGKAKGQSHQRRVSQQRRWQRTVALIGRQTNTAPKQADLLRRLELLPLGERRRQRNSVGGGGDGGGGTDRLVEQTVDRLKGF